MSEIGAKQAGGRYGRIISLRLLPGTELMNGLKKICEDNGICNGSLLTLIDSLRKLTI